jgi:HlyD family secretion protein
VRIGDQVREGQSLLLLDTDVENAQVAQARSKIAAQNDAVDAARQQLELLRIKLAKARADLARDEALFKGSALSQQALDNTRATVPDLEQQIRAQEALTRQQQSRLGEIQADIRYYQALAGQKNVRAPFNGTCLSVDVRVGEYIDAKTSIGEFAPAGPVIALTEIDELFADKIKAGQKAVIRPQGNSGVLTTGTVVLCSPYLRKKSLFSEKAGDLEDRRVREVRVQIDDPSKVLLGARVECLITVE